MQYQCTRTQLPWKRIQFNKTRWENNNFVSGHNDVGDECWRQFVFIIELSPSLSHQHQCHQWPQKSRNKRLTGHLFMLQNINIGYFLAHFRKGNNVYQFTIHYSLARFWVFFFNKQLNKHLVSVQYLILLVEGWGWLSNRSLQSTSISSHYPIEHPNPLHRHFYSLRDWNQFRDITRLTIFHPCFHLYILVK